MRNGSYRGTSDDLEVELRVELDETGKPLTLSGDVMQARRFLASFFAASPQRVGDRVSGAVEFRGNPRLHSGFFTAEVDPRGLGSFEIAVDLEGGHRDRIPGRLEWQGSFWRKIRVEIDGVAGQPWFDSYRSSRGVEVSVESAFAQAGFNVDVKIDPFSSARARDALRGYSYAEIHRAMQARLSARQGAEHLHVHVFVCTYLEGRNNRGVLGVMYDFGANDLNRSPREGVAVFGQHPLFSDPRVPEERRQREFVYTVIHEIGHALNLLHSFDKGRPASLSWMNYPHLYPLGGEAAAEHDGSAEFWRAFPEAFDDLELRHLRHATPRELAAGGFPFGVYEEGPSPIYEGGSADPRLTALGTNPLRQSPTVTLSARTTRPDYQLGEPVFVELTARTLGRATAYIPDALDPSEGFTRITIERPNGQRVRYRPPLRVCQRATRRILEPGASVKRSHAIPLFLGAQGPVFTEPGVYKIWVELGGVNGNRVAFADPFAVRIASPDRETARFAEASWSNPRALAALYLRHPLADHAAWNALEEAAKRGNLGQKRDNTTWAYLNYVAALGWSEQFEIPDRRYAEKNQAKARERLAAIADLEQLPESARERARRLTQDDDREGTPRAIATTSDELFRLQVPPNGLFGQAGLGAEKPATANPFAIVVKTHEDNPTFADVVSWNIQHLHGDKRAGRVAKIAEYMLAFRCDFWALQEVGEDGVRDLVQAMNANGDLTYAYAIARQDEDEDARGQQSACIYRTDTARVRKLAAPGFFGNKVKVSYKDGSEKTREVFLRPPLLCDVRVGRAKKMFDFRCAVVHMKSTDPSLKDKGDGMRAAAAAELARWVAAEREDGAEKDFLVMGDMNAETAKQGLAPFAKKNKLRLLSVGMKEKYGTGEDGAITRFASRRLLDHIVITEDAVALMPESDIEEQIVIRSDVAVKGFTKKLSEGAFAQYKYSDHLPVAVRFILGKDRD